jgi:hypothetical protein
MHNHGPDEVAGLPALRRAIVEANPEVTSITAGRETPRAEMDPLFRHSNYFPCESIEI